MNFFIDRFVSSLRTIAIGSWIRENTVDLGNTLIDLSGPENIFYFFSLKMSSHARPGGRHVCKFPVPMRSEKNLSTPE